MLVRQLPRKFHHLAIPLRRSSSSSTSTTFVRTLSNMASSLLKFPPVVLSGPSGAGKSTLLNRLLKQYPDKFGFSISHTTRQPRNQEKDGVQYHFVTREKFTDLVQKGEFLEHATFSGNFYGTTFGAIAAVAEQGRICILDIEMEGVKQLRAHPELGPKARVMFLKPPSLEVLEQRLRNRGTDNEDAVVARLDQARREMEFARADTENNGGVFDLVVVNEDLEECWETVRQWIVDGIQN